jgi:hypothetical protein
VRLKDLQNLSRDWSVSIFAVDLDGVLTASLIESDLCFGSDLKVDTGAR